VLDYNSQLTLNACDLRQKNRMTLVEKNKNLSLTPNNIKKNPIITARMLADGEKLKKNPINPLEVNITAHFKCL
jgi:hypothetical protein